MLTSIILAVLLMCLRYGSAAPGSEAPELPPPGHCRFEKDKDFREVQAFLSFGMDRTLFGKEGKTSDAGYIYYPQSGIASAVGLCFGGQMSDIVVPRSNACPVFAAPRRPGEIPLCKYKDMSVKARFRLTMVDYRNCKAEKCTFTKKVGGTEKTEVHGDLKAAGTIFKSVGVEASIGGSTETTKTYEITTEDQLAAEQSAFLVGVTVELVTSVGEITVPGVGGDKRVCQEDMYKSTMPVSNNFLLTSKSKTLWLDCNLSDAPVKRQVSDDPEKNFCYYLDAEGNPVEEECLN
ncbi:hypothetical protein BC939DRAFT_116316 [Gamsiella multidivaricata]|uniref:uncharacterized protein n=1 Tax=Gamsiella multidivaricata TaxID=101098 RepID=UPI00222092BB|nr:uncharacterized protein BC939DRAFT_116316 [Gamsiella multidivaricata]KAG0366206.1 hypothetical protein BGZ54_005682 [Gamsiella multidivaricata]KAI7826189.1 hypothetical protein BC939DRAFT_116316 [Gamsiella multidivaricata]